MAIISMEATVDTNNGRKRANESPSDQNRSRKKPRLAEENRRRGAFACASCHRLKEKCDGRIPCERCERHGRACVARQAGLRDDTKLSENTNSRNKRTQYLEAIAEHFLGELPQDVESLGHIVQSFPKANHDCSQNMQGQNELQGTTTRLDFDESCYSDQLSHLDFSRQVVDEVDKRLANGKLEDFGLERPSHGAALLNSDSFLSSTRRDLPPRQVANFLIEVYSEFAQTTTDFVDRAWADDRMQELYDPGRVLTSHDSPWICTMLTVLAIGSQFSSLAKTTEAASTDTFADGLDGDPEGAVGSTLYEAASRLVPNIIALCSVESVQAFSVLAQYALCSNAVDVAHVYLNLALRMAFRSRINNTLLADQSSTESQLHRRLYQAVQSWEKRLCILHGLTYSLFHDRSCTLPSNCGSLEKPNESKSIDEEDVMTSLTSWLDGIHSGLRLFLHSSGTPKMVNFARLIHVRKQYKQWWSNQSTSQTPILQLNRLHAHLHLCFYLNLVFLGRPFILKTVGRPHVAASSGALRAQAELANDAEYAAYGIIDICCMLDKSGRLARASYIERSSCHAAVLVMLAQSLAGRCILFREKLEQGVDLVSRMTAVLNPVHKEASDIVAIHTAIVRLQSNLQDGTDQQNEQLTKEHAAYEEFKRWATVHRNKQLQQSESEEMASFHADSSSNIDTITGEVDWNPFEDLLAEMDMTASFAMISEFNNDPPPTMASGWAS